MGKVAEQELFRFKVCVAGHVITGATLSIETVTVEDNCLLHPVTASVARILNVVAAVRLPVGRLIVPPLPATALPANALVALFLN